MSMMACSVCQSMVDTDFEPEGFYFPGYDYLCSSCQDDLGLEPDFNKNILTEAEKERLYQQALDEEEFNDPDASEWPTPDDLGAPQELSDQERFVQQLIKDEKEKDKEP